jgi:serine beta-lactamase-like protein LACTB, mitochondrial
MLETGAKLARLGFAFNPETTLGSRCAANSPGGMIHRMLRRHLFVIFAPALLLAQPPKDNVPPSKEKLQRIEQVVTTEMSRTSIPGVSIAIARGGRVEWTQGFGMADLENLIPVTPETRIRLGSIAKPITAIAVMQLVERGKIDLDAEVQRYVPSFPKKQWPVTIRELLGHQAGIRHYRQDGSDANNIKHYTDAVAPLEIFANDALLFEPRTKYSYSTYGFNVLGAVVESVSGMKYIDYVRENIFKPAGMDSIAQDDHFAIIPHRARGYRLANGVLQNCTFEDTSNKVAGGGWISTPTDLVKFVMAVNAGKLVKPESARLMFTAQKLRDGTVTVYGMGFFIRQANGKLSVSHSGGQSGITTNVELFPAENVAIAVMTNLQNARGLQPIAEGIAKIVLE